MATLVLRAGKGSPLTNAEVDANFTNLNTEVAAAALTASWSGVTGKPATLAGYGITDAQPVDADLTAIAALAGTSGFLKKTAANTWALDTATYLTGINSSQVTTALGFTPYNATNPSGYITASASITGNAATATALQTARTINGVSFNGSANVTVTTAGTGIGVSGSAVSIAATYSPDTATELATAVDLNTLQTAGFYYQSTNADAAAGSNYPVAHSGSLLIQRSAGITQQYQTYGTTDTELYFRSFYSTVWGGWRRVLTSSNYNSFSPTLTGTGASGTWGISVTGNAATVTNGLVSTGSYADPAWLTSVNYSKLTGTVPTWNQATTGNAATATTLQTARNINGVSFNGSANITVADATKLPLAGGTMTGAITFAGAQTWPTFNQSTTGSAATLTTGRTIAITGDVTYTSGSFNGSANVTGTATLANSGVTAGTYSSVSVDAKGRVTAGSNPTTLSGYGITDAINVSQKAAANGVATLDGAGLVPVSQLPSYVDDVLEYANLAGFPATGETGKIYVALDTNKTYRWSGTVYIYITSGAVDSVAGKTGVVTLVKGDVGLGSVDNTADAAKNVLSATKLTTARTIGGVSFDGTANINLPGVNAAGNQSTTGSAATLTTARSFGTNSFAQGGGTVLFNGSADVSIPAPVVYANVTTTLSTGISGYGNSMGMVMASDGPGGNAWHRYLQMSYQDSTTNVWQTQIAQAGTNQLYFRGREGGTLGAAGWGAWNTVLHSANYNSYSPTLTGTGASGSWGISVTGNAANVTGTVAIANGGTGATAAAGARTNLGATTLGANLFTLANVAAIAFPRINADNTVSSLDAASFRTAIGAGTSSTTGTVTSVGGTGTVSGLTLTGTVTSTGNLTLGGTLSVAASNFASQTANAVLAAPNGAAGVPTFRALVAADIPTLNQSTTGTAANVTGTVAIANGGSGATTAQTAMNAFAGAVTSGSYLRGNGTNVVMSTIQAADVPTLNQSTTGSAATLTTTRTLWGQNFNGSANVTGALSSVTTLAMSGQLTNTVAIGTAPLVITSTTRVANLNVATAGTADTLTTARTINGVSFNGSANITVADSTKLPLSGGTLTGGLTGTTYLASGAPTIGQFMAVAGSASSWYNAILRNDGSDVYLMSSAVQTTQAAANTASWNTYRPLSWSLSTGILTLSAAGQQTNVGGSLTATGNVTAYSDERLKKDWAPLATDFIERLALVKSGTYTRVDNGERQAGSSAQDWQELLPEVVTAGVDDNKTLALAYGNAALVSAIELAKKVVEQDERIKRLEALVEKLLEK